MPVSAGSETPSDSQPIPRTPAWDGDARRLFWMAFRWCLWYMRRPAAVLLALYAIGLLLALVSEQMGLIVYGFAGVILVFWAFAFSGATASAFEPPRSAAPRLAALSLFMSLRPISRRRIWHAVTFGPLLAALLVYLVCMTLPYGLYAAVWPDVSYGKWAIGDDWWRTLLPDTGGDPSASGAEPRPEAAYRAELRAWVWIALVSVAVLAAHLLLQWLRQFDRELAFKYLRESSIPLLPLLCVPLAAWSLWWLTTSISDALDVADLLQLGPWTFLPSAVGLIVMAASASRAAYASAPLLEERKRALAGLWAMAKAWAVCAGVLVLVYGIVLMLRHTGQVA
ncbi:MAG TPA: hypothetical protein DGT21_24635 [Armatimonadetes bacterium]|nr:hypothetical protein [Armatimonadota bacterium]